MNSTQTACECGKAKAEAAKKCFDCLRQTHTSRVEHLPYRASLGSTRGWPSRKHTV